MYLIHIFWLYNWSTQRGWLTSKFPFQHFVIGSFRSHTGNFECARRIFKNLWGDYNTPPVDASIILAVTFIRDHERLLNSPPYLERLWTPTASCPVVATWHVFQWKKGPDLEIIINPLNAELNPICYLLALLAHHFLHVSRIRVKSLTLRLLMSYIYMYIYIHIYGAPILDVSRSHTTTQHSR